MKCIYREKWIDTLTIIIVFKGKKHRIYGLSLPKYRPKQSLSFKI